MYITKIYLFTNVLHLGAVNDLLNARAFIVQITLQTSRRQQAGGYLIIAEVFIKNWHLFEADICRQTAM